MGTTDEVLLVPAMAPIYYANLVHNRRYGIDGEIIAIVVITVFLIFLFFLVFIPHFIMRRKSRRNSTPVDKNYEDVT